jgi:hypothetical protein
MALKYEYLKLCIRKPLLKFVNMKADNWQSRNSNKYDKVGPLIQTTLRLLRDPRQANLIDVTNTRPSTQDVFTLFYQLVYFEL